MKNLFLTLAFVLGTASSFAGSNNDLVKEEISCTVYHYVYYDGELVGEFTTEESDDNPNCGGSVFHMLKHAE